MTARERIDSLVDPDSFREINRSIISLDPLSFASRESYTRRLFSDQRRTGLTEAVVTGTCTIGGSPTMLIVLDFGFMGGTMGCVVGEKVALALERAVKRKLPAIAIVTSGGTRIQEGVLSLMQMAKTSIAANKMNEAGLPFVAVLANPATGQAYGSFANLADVILAEPGAIVGFSSFRVIQQATEAPLSAESHMAEARLEHGLIDAVTDRRDHRTVLGVLLDLFGPRYKLTRADRGQQVSASANQPEAWDSVQMARHESRPTASDYIDRIFDSFVELHGDRVYGDDRSVMCGLGQLAGQTVVLLAQERGHGDPGTRGGRTRPEGFRKAQRGMKLASKFSLPLISMIDTPGPDLSEEAEQHGLGNAIATTMAMISALDVPTISVVLGEGGSGGALAMGVADRTLMMEHAIYWAVSPEDAAQLIYQDTDRADEAAESLKLTAYDCRELEIIDIIVPEPPGGAHADPDEAARQLRRALLGELVSLQDRPGKKLLKERYEKYRNIGEYSSHFGAAINREVSGLRSLVASGVRRVTRRGRTADANGDQAVTDLAQDAEAKTE
ncbi:MAG: carboxyl transferase domain-containing protein [SAR202 cluster bacterium]|jgi:acetyl-CoA carboxylase carboxyl transferase subunit beta|nr:carboxyl transferase domain-containing protein [SAR202 cluster bacterium]MDP6299784.1 carboxyl transferase domain-containing protein [SAR202 cluster bacterium]MDP7102519.1 carboxyl transferase domain-containing protein [SAR202 cluster bacterium]MDP7223849.1 carboxyl transferase domain-containing protein [SAR202 cluster bacterium]MDP7533278.1 carboxyl transferase domain-containing protein [SAR202 cluster bacterium]|tara:strand:+ start:517 stop:2187 length:1671 start_codon:yes stop_codon:yes gene_type:complete